MTTALLVDVSCLAYRALYSTGDLSHGGEGTGVLYGVFRDVLDFADLFAAGRVAWCFDRGCDERRKLFPAYKAARRRPTAGLEEAEAESRREVRRQLYRLRTRLLGEIGYRNVLWQDGYEADDVIASVCRSNEGDMVIVSRDGDFYQLLDDRVTMYDPWLRRSITAKSCLSH